MPIKYVDFQEHYVGVALSEEHRREHFALFAAIVECLARHFCDDRPQEGRRETVLGSEALVLIGQLSSMNGKMSEINEAARDDAPERGGSHDA